MKRFCICVVALACLLVAVPLFADDAPANVKTGHGMIDKVAKDSITIRPRSADGKFEKSLVLRVTGTTTITTLSLQTRAGKKVPVQKSTEAKDLEPKQMVAVIYTTASETPTLLSAVVLPAAEK